MRSESAGRWSWFSLWLLVWTVAAIGCGVAALNWMSIATSLSQSPDGAGSALFWAAYLRFQYWALWCLLALVVGIAGGALGLVLGRRQ